MLNAADLRSGLVGDGAAGLRIDLRALPAARRNIPEINADATVDGAEALIGASELAALIARAGTPAATPSGAITEREIDRYRARSR